MTERTERLHAILARTDPSSSDLSVDLLHREITELGWGWSISTFFESELSPLEGAWVARCYRDGTIEEEHWGEGNTPTLALCAALHEAIRAELFWVEDEEA